MTYRNCSFRAQLDKCPAPVAARFKEYYFEFVLQDAGLVTFPGEEEFSASVWNRYQPSTIRNLGNY